MLTCRCCPLIPGIDQQTASERERQLSEWANKWPTGTNRGPAAGSSSSGHIINDRNAILVSDSTLLWFGQPDKPLFGFYGPPVGQVGRVLCHPKDRQRDLNIMYRGPMTDSVVDRQSGRVLWQWNGWSPINYHTGTTGGRTDRMPRYSIISVPLLGSTKPHNSDIKLNSIQGGEYRKWPRRGMEWSGYVVGLPRSPPLFPQTFDKGIGSQLIGNKFWISNSDCEFNLFGRDLEWISCREMWSVHR